MNAAVDVIAIDTAVDSSIDVLACFTDRRTVDLTVDVITAAALSWAIDSPIDVFAIIATINLAVYVFASLTGSGAVNGSIDVTTSRPRLWSLFSA